MSVTAIANNNYGASLRQADTETASNTSSTATSTGNATNSASTSATGTSTAESSTKVTLSPAAQVFAQLAAAGITFTVADTQGEPVGQLNLAGVSLPSRASGESMNDYAMNIISALAATGLNIAMTDPDGISMSVASIGASSGNGIQQIENEISHIKHSVIVPPTSGKAYNGEISQSAFDKVIQQIGGTNDQANQIFAALDTDNNGYISNSELLNAISTLGSSAAGSPGQTLLRLLVPAGDSTLTDGELLSFESKAVAAEKAAS